MAQNIASMGDKVVIRLLMTNGDSNTAGDELPDFSFQPYRHSRQTWAGQLQRFAAIPLFTNIAEGGSSSHAILRSTIKWVHGLKSQSEFRPEEVLIGIMWGLPQRFEVPDADRRWLKIYPSGASHPVSNAYYRYLHTDFFAFFTYFQNILLLQHFLEREGFPYFMTACYSKLRGENQTLSLRGCPEGEYLEDLID